MAITICQTIDSTLRDRHKISLDICKQDDVWIEQVEDKDLIVIRVPVASRRDQPVYLNGDREEAFLRRDQNDHHCSAEELDRMRREASSTSYDSTVLTDFSWDDMDHAAIKRYRAMSEKARPNLGHHTIEDDRAFLVANRAWGYREEGPTVAGILMFGKSLAIAELRNNHVIDYRREPRKPGVNVRYTDRLFFTENLFTAWEEVYLRLTRSLPKPFQLVGPQRSDRPAGIESLREAFVNLTVHTDYQEIDDAVITHRYDGYRFRNPGQSRVEVDHLGMDDASARRNQKIAELFSHVGLADRAGSGYIRIFDEWPGLGYRRPQVTSDPVNATFTVDLSLAAFIPPVDRAWLESFGESWQEDEELALWLAQRQGRIDNQTLRNHTGQHMSDASRTLVSLKNRQYLISQGAGRNIYYVLGQLAALSGGQDRTNIDGLGREPDGLPTQGDGSGHNGESSWQDGEGSGHNGESSPGIEQQLKIAAFPVASSKQTSPTIMASTLLELCSVTWLSVDHLASLLSRSPNRIRPHISLLVDSGQLVRLYPQRSHPHQRYRTTSSLDPEQDTP